jgi:hypothetical protein
MSLLRLVLVSTAVLAFAGLARAQAPQGGLAVVPGPFTSISICGTGDIASTLVMTSSFLGSSRCLSHCRDAKNDCKQVVRGAARCLLGVYGDNVSNAYKNCAETTSNRIDELACKLPIKTVADSFKESIHLEADAALADCEAWGDECEALCMGPM